MVSTATRVHREGAGVVRLLRVSSVALFVAACGSASTDGVLPAAGGGQPAHAGAAGSQAGGVASLGGQAAFGGAGGVSDRGGAIGVGGAPGSGGTIAMSGALGIGGTSGMSGAAGTASGGAAVIGPCRLTLSCNSEIEDDPKVTCDLAIQDASGVTIYADKAGVEQRGRSSLEYPKKNYGVELRNAAGLENPSPMLGMGKESDWIFDGSWVDRSFLRNDLVSSLFRELGHFAPESRACTLTLNGQNQGIYRFVEKIKRDDDRVALPEDDGTGNTFLITQDVEGSLRFPVAMGASMTSWKLVYPKEDIAVPAQVRGVQSFLDGLQAALTGPDPGNATSGVFSYLDLPNTVDFVLLEEFSKNIDAFNLSLHLARSAGSPARFIPWDFDLAFGQPTLRQGTNEAAQGWVSNRTPFITALSRVPALISRLGPRWRELRAGSLSTANVLSQVDRLMLPLRPADISENFSRWPIDEVEFSSIYRPYSLYSVASHAEELTRLRTWIETRLGWMDAHIDAYPN